MFRKFWKTLKIFIIIAVIIIIFPRSILPHKSVDEQQDNMEFYMAENEKEVRLIEFKDDNEALRLKLAQLEIINRSRKKFNAPPVKLDILASRVANKMCREAAENEFVGHWNMAGEKPYHRYAFAGGHDHVSENAFGEWSSGYYEVTSEKIGELMRTGHGSFMSERAPNDGHKKTVIAKEHNFVGIGYHLSGKQFRYYEEFIDRYFEFENIPQEAERNKSSAITVKTDGKSFLYFLVIYRDKFPQKLTPSQINRKGSYSDFSEEEYQTITAWELSQYRSGNTYKIPLKFSKEGLYYIQIFSDKKELTKPASITTRGKTPYSGIVIRVN
ncbi:MAG: hypothetical protein IPH69_17745 [Bacteroidales bacterium]|nr:hypothetical protein [Bacteroidales bacterium]